MKRIIVLLLLTGGIVAAGLLATPEPACASGCGFKPLKPLTPLGCKSLRAVCTCDASGQQCRWTWQCVR